MASQRGHLGCCQATQFWCLLLYCLCLSCRQLPNLRRLRLDLRELSLARFGAIDFLKQATGLDVLDLSYSFLCTAVQEDSECWKDLPGLKALSISNAGPNAPHPFLHDARSLCHSLSSLVCLTALSLSFPLPGPSSGLLRFLSPLTNLRKLCLHSKKAQAEAPISPPVLDMLPLRQLTHLSSWTWHHTWMTWWRWL